MLYVDPHADDHASLITDSKRFYYTTGTGRYWHPSEAPSPPNPFGAQVVRFQPKSEYLIWTGNVDCQSGYQNCRAQAQYTWNNGQDWRLVEDYVINCDWAHEKLHCPDQTVGFASIARNRASASSSQVIFRSSRRPY